mmetsp:Transcript_4606/g.7277  ORF Transcript_4606/g.7277 Transcript_4606/m.7277 type:complete len:83 (+) Transcript_4606:1487-1735(+)
MLIAALFCSSSEPSLSGTKFLLKLNSVISVKQPVTPKTNQSNQDGKKHAQCSIDLRKKKKNQFVCRLFLGKKGRKRKNLFCL